jgi:hypothetical protein
VLRISKRPEPVNLVYCSSCSQHEPFCYSRRHRPTSKNTSRGNPGCAVGPKTPTGAKTSNGAASGAPDIVRCPGRALPELATLRFLMEPLRYNSSGLFGVHRTCPVSQWSNGQMRQRSTAMSDQQCTVQKLEVRLRSQNTTDMFEVPPDCPV